MPVLWRVVNQLLGLFRFARVCGFVTIYCPVADGTCFMQRSLYNKKGRLMAALQFV